MNFRVEVVASALHAVDSLLSATRMCALEVGCMFKADEGISTATVASFLRTRGGERRFFSIDLDPDHIASAQNMLRELEPALLQEVNFTCGSSLEILPSVLREAGSIDFALLDGGGDPEVCLREFGLVLERLSANGLIIVDDLQDMAPTPRYAAARPLGKGTLILPWLILADHLENRRIRANEQDPYSALFALLEKQEILSRARGVRFSLVSLGRHRMVVIGSARAIKQTLAALNDPRFTLGSLGAGA